MCERAGLLGGHRTEGEDDRVVHEVHRDRGQEAVVEQQPEQQHAGEPGVDPTDQAEVLVRVAEGRGRRDDGRTEHPGDRVVTHELRLQRVEGRPVGQRDEPVHVEPLDQPERDEVREHQEDHGIQEHEHTEDELLEHAGVEAEPQGLGGLDRLRVGADVTVTHQSGEQRHTTTPHEEGPDAFHAGEDQAVALELGPVHEHVPAPEVVQEQEAHEADRQLAQVDAGDHVGRDVHGVDG